MNNLIGVIYFNVMPVYQKERSFHYCITAWINVLIIAVPL